MIKVSKPLDIPEKLTTLGVIEDTKNRLKFTNGESINIDNNIYGHKSVKSKLKKAQHNKCCFCEKGQDDEFGAVEHYRPKGGYKSTKEETLNKPGYYWLAYTWTNLFFVCSACNSVSNKGNLFPLVHELKRAKSHNEDESLETPLLLNPSGEMDPRDHIYFTGSLPNPKDNSIYGKKTIEICGLDREALITKRDELLDNIESKLAILAKKENYNNAIVEKAKKFIKNSVKEKAEFSATAIDFLTPYKKFLKEFKISIG